ncbi:MAG TPA: glycoside hydrolase family 88 protein [Longimicrobium sp.]|nr:glycoside hydrolase family 88 protein [Longimicrobium sp.]
MDGLGRPERARRRPLARPFALALTLGVALSLAAPCITTSAGAQVRHLPAGTGLGEGSRQPNDAPLPIPHAAPRLRPSSDGLPWSVRFARSVMRRNPQTHRRWDYTQGVVLHAIERVGLARRDAAMMRYVDTNMARWITAEGDILGYALDDYNIDEVSQGRLLFRMHQQELARGSDDGRYKYAADMLREQIRRQPRTSEGGFWHKKIYPRQMWLDGLFMGQPFYAEYAKRFNEPAAYDDIAKQFLLVSRHTRDPRTSLMYHAWDEARAQPWADSATGLSPHFWARAMGWYMVGVVETLDHFPATHPQRAAIIQTLRDAAEGVARVQDPVTGLWWDVLDQPNREGNFLEASASSMFAYALAKGARLGYLEPRYRQVAERGFGGLLSNLVRENADGTASLVNIVQVSGLGGNRRSDGSYRDGSFAYYVSEPVVTDDYKGVGPFILAALELGR